MATYAIGDIQGCYEPLQQLLDRINFDPARDRLWFTGDLVNRGPQSLEVLRFVRKLGPAADTVLGNHDLHLLTVAAGHVRAKRTDTVTEILAADDGEELLDWLRHRPLLHESEELPGIVLAHAGIAPPWGLATARTAAREVEAQLRGPDHREFLYHLYGDHPSRWSPTLNGWDRLRYITNAFTRMRYCAPDGRLLMDYKGDPAAAPEGYYPWFELSDRPLTREGVRVIFGHWSTLGLVNTPEILALDTGCLWGGSLTAVQLDDGGEVTAIGCETVLEPAPGR
ncbi:symmetrical bis(5'-nucleosyl)-tetraphosphatase [Arhodomonas sp. AD133]|uniref:symmetrical bis(5'-nucleosyl)-tetraphosphatase n=1 Tax=Arhodomonas sp. AD133 TaxID=3415009 RepID=UPI003EB784DF